MPQNSAPRPKKILFCPRCGHESPADGDWCVRGPDAHSVTCPAHAAVLRRSAPSV